MAYREHGMWEVLDVLRRHARGERVRGIARATGHDRRTVRGYLKRAAELGWRPGKEPDEALAVQVAAAKRPGPRGEPESGVGVALLAPHRDRIQEWLVPADGGPALQLTRVHELLGGLGVHVSYSSLRRFVSAHCELPSSRGTVRMAELPPGEVAEIDFGLLGLVPDPQRHKRRRVYALIVTLVHSRHMYVHVCATQKLPDVLAGLEDAWDFFGGVTRRVILQVRLRVRRPHARGGAPSTMRRRKSSP